MKHLLIILFAFSFIVNAHAFPKEKKTIEEQIVGTWRMKNVQKMQGLVIRTQKYTKDGGDTKAFIKRFKGGIFTFNADSTVTFVSPNGKRTVEGTWKFGSDEKHHISGAGTAMGHDVTIASVLTIVFPAARSFNIDGDYNGYESGAVRVQSKFYIIDTKYMFKFERVVEEGDKTEDDK